MRIKFHAFEKEYDKPSGSGYCQKLETYFRAVGYTEYTIVPTLPYSAPKGKLPYVVIDDNETVADSHFIVQHLIRTGVTRDLDAALTPAQRADSRAWQTYVEELVYPATVWHRWGDPVNYAEVSRASFGKIPWPVRPALSWYMQRSITQSLTGHGVARHSPDEVKQILEEYFTNLEARLGPGDEEVFFFRGEEPTMVDTIAYAFMVNALATLSNPIVRSGILKSATLCRYVMLLTERWFPEYEPLLKTIKTEGAQ